MLAVEMIMMIAQMTGAMTGAMTEEISETEIEGIQEDTDQTFAVVIVVVIVVAIVVGTIVEISIHTEGLAIVGEETMIIIVANLNISLLACISAISVKSPKSPCVAQIFGRFNSKKMMGSLPKELPFELVLKIFSMISQPDYVHINSAKSKKQAFLKTFNILSKVSKSWNSAANYYLWRNCVVDARILPTFVYSLLESVVNDADDIEIIQKVRKQQDRIISLNGPQVEGTISVLDLELAQQLDFIDVDLDSVEFDNRLQETLTAARIRKTQSQTTTIVKKPSLGLGKLIKSIWIPSFHSVLEILEFVFPLIPNCKSIKFVHPPHGTEYIPTLRPWLIKKFENYLEQFESVAVEDVDEDGWPLLVDALIRRGSNLKVLSLEACSEKEAFGSKKGLSALFPFLDKLECLRIDGLPIGSFDFSWGGDMDLSVLATSCPNLRAVSLDFCDLTLQAFYTLWNSCPNLEFLGLAGLGFSTSELAHVELVQRPKLLKVRFVDCQVNDTLVRIFCLNCRLKLQLKLPQI
jgi:hypothetical protein